MIKLTNEQVNWLAERIPDVHCTRKSRRSPADKRQIKHGIYWVLDNGAKWNHSPRESCFLVESPPHLAADAVMVRAPAGRKDGG